MNYKKTIERLKEKAAKIVIKEVYTLCAHLSDEDFEKLNAGEPFEYEKYGDREEVIRIINKIPLLTDDVFGKLTDFAMKVYTEEKKKHEITRPYW